MLGRWEKQNALTFPTQFVTSKVTRSGQCVFWSINIKIASLAQIKGIVIEHQHESILFTPYVFFLILTKTPALNKQVLV